MKLSLLLLTGVDGKAAIEVVGVAIGWIASVVGVHHIFSAGCIKALLGWHAISGKRAPSRLWHRAAIEDAYSKRASRRLCNKSYARSSIFVTRRKCGETGGCYRLVKSDSGRHTT